MPAINSNNRATVPLSIAVIIFEMKAFLLKTFEVDRELQTDFSRFCD